MNTLLKILSSYSRDTIHQRTHSQVSIKFIRTAVFYYYCKTDDNLVTLKRDNTLIDGRRRAFHGMSSAILIVANHSAMCTSRRRHILTMTNFGLVGVIFFSADIIRGAFGIIRLSYRRRIRGQ